MQRKSCFCNVPHERPSLLNFATHSLPSYHLPKTNNHQYSKDYNAFVKTISSMYGATDAIVEAESELRQLKHTGSCADYVTNYQNLAAITQRNEASLISHL